MLWCCIIGDGITVKLSTSKLKIRYNFVESSLIFQFLYVNVLNYCYFHTNCSTFFNKKNVEKTLKTRFYRKIKKNVYKRLLQLWKIMKFVKSHISCQNYFCRIAKFGEDILNNRPTIITSGWFFSTANLTSNFDLDLSKVLGEILHRRWSSVQNFMKIGLLQWAPRTNEPTNTPDHNTSKRR